MIARLYPNYETRALVPHSSDRPADLLVLVRGHESDQPDMARHAIDVTVCDPIGSSNLTDVLKALSSPSPGPAIGETRKRVRFAAQITQVQLMVPDWGPDLPFTHWVSISMAHGNHLRYIFLTLQLLLAPRPRLNLKLASSAALSKSSVGRSRS
jgi:hypothetical protein